VEPGVSLPCSSEPDTGLCPELSQAEEKHFLTFNFRSLKLLRKVLNKFGFEILKVIFQEWGTRYPLPV
jgi:hypothetical protein